MKHRHEACKLFIIKDSVFVEKQNFNSSRVYEIWQTSRRSDSTFMSSVHPSFLLVQRFFHSQLGDGQIFRFWDDDWPRHG